MKKWIFGLICLVTVNCYTVDVFAQASQDSDSASAFAFIRFQYSLLSPAGDFEKTFGVTQAVGGALAYKTATNWHFEVEGSFLFGGDVKRKDLLSGIINEAGDVTDADGELVKVILDMRAYSLYGSVGKLFPIFGNQNSGILVQFGVGYLQHRIKVDFRDGEVFQFSDEMLKGYDRLHRGVALKQFVGYQYFGKRNLINFNIGFEFNQGFTKNKREYNYDSRSFDKGQKTDLLNGLRIGWTIPIKERTSDDFYYY